MKLNFVDHEDFEHIVNTLSKDFKLLFNKMKSIEERSRLTIGGLNKTINNKKCESWKNPISKFEWQLHYEHYKTNKNYLISFIPITEYTSTKGEKIYISLSKEDSKYLPASLLTLRLKNSTHTCWRDPVEFLRENKIIINVFRGHFLKQYRTHLNNDYNPYDIIGQFLFNKKSFLVDIFQQNEKWVMFLHNSGVAMIKETTNFHLFDTYVPVNKLYQDQIDAISNHLSVQDEDSYFLTSLNMLQSSGWISLNLIDNDRIINNLREFKRSNPKGFSLYEPILLKYLKGIALKMINE
jgi:hypothetical protein